jgi:peroxiredoxin
MAETRTGMRAALRGFVEGVFICLVALVGVRLLRGGGLPRLDSPFAVLLCVGGGLVFAIGRGIAGRTVGAFAGGVAGAFLGALLLGLAVPLEAPPDDAVGRPFALEGPTLAGKQVSVADYRGKVVLIDFWATRCPPCVEELPNVLAAYEKYHGDGFEVLGVSLDTSRERLEKFVKQQNMPWPQVFFDEEEKRGWNSPAAREHGVNAIPATFLLDREGNVAATNLRGARVARTVAFLLGNGGGGNARPGVPPASGAIPMTVWCMFAGALILAAAGALLQRRLMAGPRQGSS